VLTNLLSPATATHLLLSVVGSLFAVYLLGLAGLVLLTVAMKLTASHGEHRLVLDLVAVETTATSEVPLPVQP